MVPAKPLEESRILSLTRKNKRRDRSGGLFASPDAQTLLSANNLGDLDQVFCSTAKFDYRRGGRGVWSTDLYDCGGDPVRVFIKTQWGRRRITTRPSHLAAGLWRKSRPTEEWEGIARLKAAGLNVPERLAVFEQGRLSFRAAVIIKAVPARESVDSLLQSGRWDALPRQHREAILDAIIESTRSIHAAGLAWGGISCRHYFPLFQDDQTCTTWLIDLESVHVRNSRRIIQRNYDKLCRSMHKAGADAATLSQLQSRIDRVLSGRSFPFGRFARMRPRAAG